MPSCQRSAGRVLAELGYENVKLVVGDGTLGWPAEAPYRGILAAAATAECPPALLEQLAEGGRLVIPIGAPGGQILESIERTGDKFAHRAPDRLPLRAARGGRNERAPCNRRSAAFAHFHTRINSKNAP